MRQRSIFVIGLATSLTALAGGTLLGCEDGPSQTFTPAPANAGNLWNNGNPDASVADGRAPFDSAFGSVSALQHCTADEQRLVWANMLNQPIIPPLQFAGLNLAYDQKFDGITLQEAEKINCTGNPLGPGGVSWGDNGEVLFFYTTSNYIVNALQLNLGYNGKMTFRQAPGSRFGQHEYIVQLGQPMLKDSEVLEVNWQDFGPNTVVNEIFNGLMFSFGQDLVGGTATGDYDTADCGQDGSCLSGGPASAAANGGECYMGFLPLEGLLILTDCTTTTQPTISIPIQMQQQYYLSEPYSYEASVATINAQGPVSLPRFNNQTDPPNCYVQMGMDWKTYIENCIDTPAGMKLDQNVQDAGLVGSVTGLTINQVNENKAVAAPTHDYETYDFDIVGENLSWTDETIELPANVQQVVQDNSLPSVTDAVQARINSWGSDLYDKGVPINDTVNGSFSGKGSGYVYREWARLAQLDINKILAAANPTAVGAGGTTIYNHVIGDPACAVPPTQAQALGCTGMEGLAIQVGNGFTAGDPADNCTGGGAAAPVCANYTAGAYFAGLFGAPGYGATVLRPGNDLSIFCQNPGGVNTGTDPLNGNCVASELWEGALQNVTMVAGLGNTNNLPQELADRRYYFRWYGIAMIKYLKAYGINAAATAADVAAQTIDLESIFFDSQNDGGGSTYDEEEYIERSFMTKASTTYLGTSPGTGQGSVTIPAWTEDLPSMNSYPMDFNYGADTLAANQRTTTWAKFMYRQELALFKAMLENKADLPGAENNVNITNLAGSQLLQQNYGSYECATEWPTVTIPVAGGTNITGAWADVCGGACPGWSSFYPLSCPNPPLLPPDALGNQTLQLDLNGSSPGLGLGGTTPRLANYKAVWGRGSACTDPSTPTATNAQLNPTATGNNPYSTTPCNSLNNGFPVPTGVGSVFSVGQRDKNSSRLKYDNATGGSLANTLIGTNPNNLIAFVDIPNMPNPYNAITLPGDPLPTTIQVTVPWINSFDGVGFSIPVDAGRDKFWQTQQLDFGGILMTYRLDVVPYQDPITLAYDGTLTVDAIEGDDFLGEAFLCQDVGELTTPGTGDILGAHMYDSAASVLAWITNHPGSEVNCNIIVRYSIYDNYIDYITSLSAGVQLDINQGGGYGRVVGVIAFDPALSAAP